MKLKKDVTIYDIAVKLSLSSATVSRGLQDNPAINKNTRKRIQQTAREPGYRHNTFASSLRTQYKTYPYDCGTLRTYHKKIVIKKTTQALKFTTPI